jgi:L-threonylcarbamoyladenylate synthase
MTSARSQGFRLRIAACRIAQGGVVAYPTEAVFGLGADPDNPAAVRRILELKRRPTDKGLILIAATPEALEPYIASLSTSQWDGMVATWPGPVTWLVPAARQAPALVTGGSGRIAVRVPDHALARRLCVAWGGALVSTSANRAGRPAIRTATAVRRRFGTGLAMIVSGPVGGRRLPTTIRSLASGAVLRAG